jgi:WD40 repeat protein
MPVRFGIHQRRRIATGFNKGKIGIWDSETKEKFVNFEGHKDCVN